jgi:hypothetical protein
MALITSTECLKIFGHPSSEKYMKMWDVPTPLEIGAIPKRIYCSTLLPLALEEAFRNLIDADIVNELRTWDGCYNLRLKKGGSTYSMHAWGLAIDVNAAWNGFGKPPKLSQAFVDCFTSEGFEWGGKWKTPDGMHFELSKEFILKHS